MYNMKFSDILKAVGVGLLTYQNVKSNRGQNNRNAYGSTNSFLGRAVQRGMSNFRNTSQEYQRLNQNGTYQNVSSSDLLNNLNQKGGFSMAEKAAMLHELEKRSNNK